MSALPDLEALLAAAEQQADAAAALAGLAGLVTARARLDELERGLIDRARAQGATWAQIAVALGLASRQAAEQRWLRLGRDGGARPARAEPHRRDLDTACGAGIVQLRAALARLHRQVCADRRWATRFPAAALVRDSLALARSAPPGAMFYLAEKAVADLGPVSDAQLSQALRTAVARVRGALLAARPDRDDHPGR